MTSASTNLQTSLMQFDLVIPHTQTHQHTKYANTNQYQLPVQLK